MRASHPDPGDPLNIEEFYDQDPRRRDSEELELGHGWRVAGRESVTYQVSWIEDTGEVYAMAEPQLPPNADVFGDVWANAPSEKAETVEVLGRVDSREELDRLLLGWQEAMEGEDSLGWVRSRLTEHTSRPPDDTPPPPEEGAEEIPGA